MRDSSEESAGHKKLEWKTEFLLHQQLVKSDAKKRAHHRLQESEFARR